jgi:oxygen-independent coproporphyrinogen-3 oxidase
VSLTRLGTHTPQEIERLALGPSAHSFDSTTGERWKNFSSLHKYANLLSRGEPVIEWKESLTADQRETEKWLLALRLDDGFPREWLDTEIRRKKAEMLIEKGLLEPHPKRVSTIRLTPRGFALSDQIIAEFVG